MTTRKDEAKKEFLIATRKKLGPSIVNAPFWVVQKAGKRIWNKRSKRHWRQTKLGGLFTKLQRKSSKRKVKGRKHYQKGKKNRAHKRDPRK